MPFGASIKEAFRIYEPLDTQSNNSDDIKNPFNPATTDPGLDLPDIASNFVTDNFDTDQNRFLSSTDIQLPTNVTATPTPSIAQTVGAGIGTGTGTGTGVVGGTGGCTDAKCVEILNHLMNCPGCRDKLNNLLNINRNTFLGIDFSKIDYQKVLFYIIVAIIIIAFYELFNMIFSRGGGTPA